MRILGIDTSCDETSAAMSDGIRVLSNVISTQIRYHKKYGGVVPMLAQRLHAERIEHVVEMALQRAGCEYDAIAVTYGPGLAPALQVGVSYAKDMAHQTGKPLYAVNHMVGHIASALAQTGTKLRPTPAYPLLAVLVSGGHTELVYVPRFGVFEIVGQTVDDALGEAYDKVAKLLGLGYPGGVVLAKLAEHGLTDRYNLPVPMQNSGDCNLSYSGLKTAVRTVIEKLPPMDARATSNLAASFQYVAQRALLLKVERVLNSKRDLRTVLLAGGVAANAKLRWNVRLLARQQGLDFLTPSNLKLCTDNAAMISVAAYLGSQAGQSAVDPFKLDRAPGVTIDEAPPQG